MKKYIVLIVVFCGSLLFALSSCILSSNSVTDTTTEAVTSDKPFSYSFEIESDDTLFINDAWIGVNCETNRITSRCFVDETIEQYRTVELFNQTFEMEYVQSLTVPLWNDSWDLYMFKGSEVSKIGEEKVPLNGWFVQFSRTDGNIVRFRLPIGLIDLDNTTPEQVAQMGKDVVKEVGNYTISEDCKPYYYTRVRTKTDDYLRMSMEQGYYIPNEENESVHHYSVSYYCDWKAAGERIAPYVEFARGYPEMDISSSLCFELRHHQPVSEKLFNKVDLEKIDSELESYIRENISEKYSVQDISISPTKTYFMQNGVLYVRVQTNTSLSNNENEELVDYTRTFVVKCE
ncbi:MAG: hypothetical protein IJW62_00415 [Clostridia bacterium]|nr:hypothetical protein [Clostridia bacterium]